MEKQKIVIIGGGPTAWSAAIYTGRADLKPVVLAGEKAGGQLALTTVVENYPGFSEGVDGPLLIEKMRKQAERFGAQVVEEMVMKIECDLKEDTGFKVMTNNGDYLTEAVLIATGAETVWLNVPGEKALIGRGVSSCAVCDAAFFRGKDTMVVGGGDAAMEDTLALVKFAKSVTIVHRRDEFKASKIMAERVLANEKVTVRWNSGIERITGETRVTGVAIKNYLTGAIEEQPIDGVFVAIGHKPSTAFVRETVDLDEKGYIETRLGLNQKTVDMAKQNLNAEGRVAYPTMTSCEGIFAAGDCVDFHYRQAITAAAFGVMAALDVEKWLGRV